MSARIGSAASMNDVAVASGMIFRPERLRTLWMKLRVLAIAFLSAFFACLARSPASCSSAWIFFVRAFVIA